MKVEGAEHHLKNITHVYGISFNMVYIFGHVDEISFNVVYIFGHTDGISFNVDLISLMNVADNIVEYLQECYEIQWWKL